MSTLPSLHNPRALLVGSAALPLMSNWPSYNTPETPFGRCPGPLWLSKEGDEDLLVIPRHGVPHSLAPHKINYRALIYTLKQLGVLEVLASHTVGGVSPSLPAGTLVIPDQLIDYTYGREHTFFGDAPIAHIEFADPFHQGLQQRLVAAAATLEGVGSGLVEGGVYGVTQGPRLETAAEIQRMARDGCTLVGMTAMPEAALARELGIAYASLCLVVNPAAGVTEQVITLDEIRAVARNAAEPMQRLLLRALRSGS